MPGYSSTREVDCLVIGSGVSGSTLAFNLVKNHGIENTLLVERNDVVGGNLISKENDDGFVWEEGPNSFQPTPYVSRIVHELGLDDDLVLADASIPRFIYWHEDGAGEKQADLHALPASLKDLLFFKLLTWRGMIRAGSGALGYIDPPPKDREESVREFLTRHLGEETFERVVSPLISAIFAGDADELSMQATLKDIHRLEGLGKFGPGLVSGALVLSQEMAKESKENPPDPSWPKYMPGQSGSFQKGLQTLALAIEDYLGKDRVWKSSPAESIEKLPDGRFQVTIAKEGKKTKVVSKAVCMTTPTRVTCKLAADLIPAAAGLSQIYSPPIVSVNLAYPKSAFKSLPGGTPDQPLNGFGIFFPPAMGLRSLVSIWYSSLFPGKAPEGWELILTYVGGSGDKIIADLSVDEIYQLVDSNNQKMLLKPDAAPGKRIGCRIWPAALPVTNKGHLKIMEALQEDEAKCPGLFLGGNYRTGVNLNDCIQFGWTEADKVAEFLKPGQQEPTSSGTTQE